MSSHASSPADARAWPATSTRAPASRLRLAALPDGARAALPPLLALLTLYLAARAWRPRLTWDSWGYYDAVVQTLAAGAPRGSDWLSPAIVGLTTPVALTTALLGGRLAEAAALWTAALTALGLVALTALARRLGATPTEAAIVAVTLLLSPAVLELLLLFYGNVVALGLTLAAVWGLLASRPGRPWPLLAGALALGWAGTIRDNALVPLVWGLATLALQPGLSVGTRLRRCLLWGLPFAVLAALRLAFVSPTFGQTVTLPWRLSHFDPFTLENGVLLLRNWCYAQGVAALALLLARRSSTLAWLRAAPRAAWATSGLLAAALLAAAALGVASPFPNVNNLFLDSAPGRLLTLGLALLGAIWGPAAVAHALRRPMAWRTPASSAAFQGLCALYLALLARYDSAWLAYLIEPSAFALLAALALPAVGPRRDQGEGASPPDRRRPRYRLAPAILAAGLALTAWSEAFLHDADVFRLHVFEPAFRAGACDPRSAHGPFGLAAWHLFEGQIAAYHANPAEVPPLEFWREARLDGCRVRLTPGDDPAHGAPVRLGGLPFRWRLEGASGGPGVARPFPLTAEETWLAAARS